MGKALADHSTVCAKTFAEADAALGEPLSDLIFNGPGTADAHREHPAGDPDDERGGRLLASRGLAGLVSSPGHSLGEYSATWPPAPWRLPTRCDWCGTAAATCRRPCRSGGRDGGDSRPRRGGVRCARARPRGRGGQPAPTSTRRARWSLPGSAAAVARASSGQGAGRQAGHSAPGERAVPLRADEAGRGAPGAGAARAAGRDPRVPVVANVDAAPRRASGSTR